MPIAIASCSDMPPEFTDDRLLAAALRERGVEAEIVAWDDPAVAWAAYEAVVIRSTWDYARRRGEYLRWCDAVGTRLHNNPELVRWNSDKRYLGDLAEAGIPVVATIYAEPDAPSPGLAGELVVKPNVSAGGRDSGRFSPATHGLAHQLIEAIHDSGRTAMIQPYEPSVDELGETAVLMIDGKPAHVLRKRAVLRPDEIAPIRDDGVGAAEAMYDPGLVTAAAAAADELELAAAVVAEVERRFAYLPLYARVDMIRDATGAPMVLELEAIEPNFYLDRIPATAATVANAIAARI